MEIHKPVREKDSQYLAYIREQSCAACLNPNSEPHHLQSRGSYGSDYSCVPLCRGCHTKVHTMGVNKFLEATNVNLWKEAWELFKSYEISSTIPSDD